MGADLICYIALGPGRIDLGESKGPCVAEQVREYLDGCIAAAEGLLLGQDEAPDPRPGPVEAKRSITLCVASPAREQPQRFRSLEHLRSHPDYQDLIRGALMDCDRDAEAEHAFPSTPTDLADQVQAFAAGWNTCCFRDMAEREDPENPGRKVVVAGEMSWGDEPDGAGYRMLKRAFSLTIAQRLGVK